MQILEVDEDRNVVADLSQQARGKDVVETESTLDQPAPVRPSLDVAIDTLGHLRPRIEALCLRMAGWDKREMGMELRAAFGMTVAKWETATADLAAALDLLQSKGFVAKTTAKTRKLAQMKPGTPVKLDPALVMDYAEIYSADELSSLDVVRTVGAKIFLRTGSREVGLVDVSKVEVRE